MGTSCKVKVMTDWVKGEISWGDDQVGWWVFML